MRKRAVKKMVLALRDSEAFDPGLLADLLSLLRSVISPFLFSPTNHLQLLVGSNTLHLIVRYFNVC